MKTMHDWSKSKALIESRCYLEHASEGERGIVFRSPHEIRQGAGSRTFRVIEWRGSNGGTKKCNREYEHSALLW
jgi:hypothetical protein